MTLVNPSFEAHVTARDHAVVNVKGGRIHVNNGNAVEASGFAKIVLDGTTVDGQASATGSGIIETRNNALITGKVKSDSASNLVGLTSAIASSIASSKPSPRKPDPASKACTGMAACYNGYSGQVNGKLVVTLEAFGTVQKVAVTGNANAAQKACLMDLGQKKSFAPGELPSAGNLTCEWSGTVNNGMVMMSQSSGFTPSK